MTDEGTYAAEARARWGETDAYRESERRTASYSRADWAEMRAELVAIEERLAWLLTSGSPADGNEAREAAERHRRHLTRWVYDCDPHRHPPLAPMYVTGAGFPGQRERPAPGRAPYVHHRR